MVVVVSRLQLVKLLLFTDSVPRVGHSVEGCFERKR